MPKLPSISGKEAIKIFEKLGFKVTPDKGAAM
jgi:predicted RNA binding protein YcfA (HicA-like mRNA interferase family)